MDCRGIYDEKEQRDDNHFASSGDEDFDRWLHPAVLQHVQHWNEIDVLVLYAGKFRQWHLVAAVKNQ